MESEMINVLGLCWHQTKAYLKSNDTGAPSRKKPDNHAKNGVKPS